MSVARYAYGRSSMRNEQAANLAAELAGHIAGLYDEKITHEEVVEACCEVEKRVREVSVILARDLLVWRQLLEVAPEGVPAAARASLSRVHACARWKIEKIAQALVALETAALERTYMDDDEEPGDDHVGVVEIEVRG